MTNVVQTLTWQSAADANAPIAPYTVNFATDILWIFKTTFGTYADNPVTPGGVSVDNSQGATAVNVTIGSLLYTIPPFQRLSMSMSGGAAEVSIAGIAPNSVPVLFWVTIPAPDIVNQNAIAQQAAALAIATGICAPYFGLGTYVDVPTGWVLWFGSIGSSLSGATNRANDDTQALFVRIWQSCVDADAPVSGGRGASALLDFLANKTITFPDPRGNMIGCLDTLTGSARSKLTLAGGGFAAVTAGNQGGNQAITLTAAQSGLVGHTHTGSGGINSVVGLSGSGFWDFLNVGAGGQDKVSTGSGTVTINPVASAPASSAHSNVQPGIVMPWIVKL